MRKNPPPELPFTECDTCKVKPGSPTLCNGCLKNRQVIYSANRYINKLLSTKGK